MVTHDRRAAEIADRVLFIADGRVAGELDGVDDDVTRALEAVGS
jgi:ABC-type lipoprotein export system ATPase subunit